MKNPRKPSGRAIKAPADLPEAPSASEPSGPSQKSQRPAGGRPTAFKPEFVESAKKLCVLGATDVEMADFFNVAVSTFYLWKHNHPQFSEALTSGKAAADERVERSLYHKAIGYTFEAEEIFQYQGGVVRAKVRKHVPPSDTAGIFWLKNRRPDKWRDIQQHEHGAPGDFARMSDDELDGELVKQAKALGLPVAAIRRMLSSPDGETSH